MFAVASMALAAVGSHSPQIFVNGRGPPAVNTPGLAADGSKGRPFGTVSEATSALRALPSQQRCGATVTIAAGVYGGEANALRLTDADSGCRGAPITYRAEPGASVLLHGGVAVPPAAFKKSGTTAAGLQIWSAALPAAGGLEGLAATSGQFHTGWVCANGNRTEFFFGGEAMTLARHPNKRNGTWQYLRAGATVSPTSFVVGTDDSAGGAPVAPNATVLRNLGPGAWAHGYWTWDWADSFVPVLGAATVNGTAVLKLGGSPQFGLKKGSRYVLLNSMALLDAPGEYFISTPASVAAARGGGGGGGAGGGAEVATLYFIPPVGAPDPPTVPSGDADGAFLSQAAAAHTIVNGSDLTLHSLSLGFAMGAALSAANVRRLTVDNCTLANSGTAGAELTGHHSTISGGRVFGVGCDGLSVSGGDAVGLVRSELSVHSNTIHSFARVSRTIRPGIAWSGCGLDVTANEIFDAPHSGIMIAPASDGVGVDCLFEGNYLHDLCQGTADAGGFYAGRTWANRGNVIRGNLFKDFVQREAMAQATSVNGIYLDDMESGWTVLNNTFVNAGERCMFIGGGRQNTVMHNTFVNCTVPLHVDTRGLGWMKCGAGQVYPKKFTDELSDVFHYQQQPWASAFSIDTTLVPCAPVKNVATNNSYCTTAAAPAPPPPPPGPCARCPTGHPFGYTPSPTTGSYCCSAPVVGGGCPSKQICCLTPGSQAITPWGTHGCEGITRCGSNRQNHTACSAVGPGGGSPFTDFTGDQPEWQNTIAGNFVPLHCEAASSGWLSEANTRA
jgi:hypothetical protein